MIKRLYKMLSLFLVGAILFNNFSPLIALAMTDETATSMAIEGIKAKGNIEVELHLALPVRNREETNINLSIYDANKNKASISLNEMKNAKDGILETHLKLGDENGQNIRTLITKRDLMGNVLSGDVTSDNVVYYSINLYALDKGTYTIEFSGNNFVTYSIPVTLKDFSQRITLSNEKGMFEIGDVNHDNKVDKDDENIMISAIESNDLSKDLNLDGIVDIADLNYITAVISGTKGSPEIEDTSAIIDSENVSVEVPKDVTIEGNLSDLFNDNDSVVTLKSEGEVSEENPIEFALDLGGNTKEEAVEMSEIRIGVGQNAPQKMKVKVLTADGETEEIFIDDTTQGNTAIHTFTDEITDGTIKVNLGKQVAVKKVTIIITETSSSNLADIAKVEFLNNVKVQTTQPEGFGIPDNIKVDDTKSEQLTVTFNSVPNVTGYEVKIVGPKMESGKVFQTTFTSFTIEDLKNYANYKVYVQSASQEWRSGWSEAIEASPKATRKPPKVDMVKATPSVGKIDFSWKAMDDTVSYKLYYREAGESEFTEIEVKTGSSYSLNGLKPATKYQAYVLGVNPLGISESYTLVEATTEAAGAAVVPKYKLINDGYDQTNKKTTHIKDVKYTIGTMTDDNKFAMVDDDYNTYFTFNDWTAGSHGYQWQMPTIILDQTYKMDEFVLTVPDDFPYSFKAGTYDSSSNQRNDTLVYYWNTDGEMNKDNGAVVPGILTSKKDDNGRPYYVLKLEKPIEANAIQFGLTNASNQKLIQIDEVKFYHYDSLVDDVAKLFTDDLRLELAEGVNQKTIDDLKERADEKDHGEYSPYRDSVLADLDYAEKILKDQAIDDVITLNPNISNTYNNHVRFAMTISDYQPLGVVARPGETLNVYVGSQGNVNVQLVFTQYHAEASEWNKTSVNLKKGLNIIEVPKIGSSSDERGGSVYIKYTSVPNVNVPIKVRVSGGTKIPMVDTTLLTSEEDKKKAIRKYVETLKTYNNTLSEKYEGDFDPKTSVLGSTEIVTKYGLFSVSSVAVENALNSNTSNDDERVNRLYNSMEAFDEMMEFFYRQKGFVETDDAKSENRMPKARINIRYMQMFDGAFMYAGGYHVGIEYGSIAGLVQANKNTPTKTGYFGWGISHEIGHQINLNSTVFAEVTNNVYSLLAQTSNDHDLSRLEIQGYDKIYDKVTSHTIGRAQNVFVQLGMYWQLHLAYDKNKTFEDKDSIYARINKFARTYDNANKYSRDDLTILFASEAAEKDLTDFFEAWGLIPSAALKEELSKFEKETRPIYYLNDTAWRYTLNKKDGITKGADILTASIQNTDAENKRVTINLGLTADKDKILGYEILRNGVSVGFVENKENVNEFVDNLGAENNRAYTYEVVAYDYYLTPTNKVTLDEIKISHDGSVKKDAFTISSNVMEEHEQVDPEDENMDYSKLNVNKLIDGNPNTGFDGIVKIKSLSHNGDKVSLTTDKGNAYVIINLNNSMSVSGIKYTALVKDGELVENTIKKYKVYVSATGEDKSWVLARSGEFKVTKDNPEEKIYFMGQGTDSESQLWTYDGVGYIKIESDGNTSGLSGAEIDVIAPPGDNVEISTTTDDGQSIGVLKEDYCYLKDGCTEDEKDKDGNVIGKKGQIKAGSVVFKGTYAGSPSFNVITIANANDASKMYSGEQIIFAEINSDMTVYEVAEGTWLYVMSKEQYEAMVAVENSIRVYMYRVNNSETNEGQRLTSTSRTINNLPSYENLKQMIITDNSAGQ